MAFYLFLDVRILIFIVFISLAGCHNGQQKNNDKSNIDTSIEKTTHHKKDTSIHKEKIADTSVTSQKVNSSSKVYSNKRFKGVTVEKQGSNKYIIKGKAQIFEAAFSWVIEDGHEELQKGFAMTDAGAPEWGNFSFTVEARKKRANSTLHLILFESSAKDGSRQYELPVLLY